MNKKFLLTNLAVFSLLTVSMSCSEEKNENKTMAARLNIELGAYSDAETETSPLWAVGDKVGIVNTSSGETDLKSPISGGSGTAMFVFNLKDIEKGTEIIGYFPADEFSSVSADGFTVNIPSEQKGDATPRFIGSVPYKDNANLKLEPFGCRFVAHISKGDYAISKAVLKSNAGEKISGTTKTVFASQKSIAETDNITVTLDKPLDCSSSGQYISFLTAPATLSQGYSIEYTTSEGKTMTFSMPKKTELNSGEAVHSGNYMKILCLGNSFTLQQNTPVMLERIASSQGYCLNISSRTHDSFTFAKHLSDKESQEVIRKGGYDYAFIQDQSQAAANYANDKNQYGYVYTDTEKLAAEILKYSPDCKIILELTWSFPAKNNSFGGFESYEKFDRLLRQGVLEMAQKANTWVSPIGPGFIIAREKHPEVDLYNTDRKHQSEYGAYLKACVNYLVLTGKEFKEPVHDSFLNAEKTKAMRQCAQEAVLGKEGDYFIER